MIPFADVMGSNIVEKCDVTLSRAMEPLTSDVLLVLFFLAYFTISVFRDNTDCPCFEVKARMKRTCSWRRQLKGTKPVEAKDRVNDYETCESEE